MIGGDFSACYVINVPLHISLIRVFWENRVTIKRYCVEKVKWQVVRAHTMILLIEY